MPDVRDKMKAKARAQKHKHDKSAHQNTDENVELKQDPEDWPGDNNELPNNAPADAEPNIPGDVARDITNDGVINDPYNKPIP